MFNQLDSWTHKEAGGVRMGPPWPSWAEALCLFTMRWGLCERGVWGWGAAVAELPSGPPALSLPPGPPAASRDRVGEPG